MCQSSSRMRGHRVFLLLWALFLAVGTAGAAPLCEGEGGRCTLANGFYFAEVPQGWNRRDPLPVLVHFHGFREFAADIISRDDMRDIAAKQGFVLVVPQGEGQTWSHPGSPSQLRDDVAFAESLLAICASACLWTRTASGLPVSARALRWSGCWLARGRGCFASTCRFPAPSGSRSRRVAPQARGRSATSMGSMMSPSRWKGGRCAAASFTRAHPPCP